MTEEPIHLHLQIHKRPARPGPVAAFGIVRNEMYFLPHLLHHYRQLGIREFWFHDDQSDDGTYVYLMAQPDCGVTQSKLRFGDRVGHTTLGAVIKDAVPRNLLMNRWVLTIDADEFLILPPGTDTVEQLAAQLERNGLQVARALMVDFFPAKLRDLCDASRDIGPFELCPYFDVWKRLVWPDGVSRPTDISAFSAVRPRILKHLKETGVDLHDVLADYKIASVAKMPLVYWQADMRAYSSHRVSVPPSDRVQLAFAHFKFYPGHEQRTAQAVAEAVHWQGAIEYRILQIANRELMDWPLAGPCTRRFDSPRDMTDSGLVYSRLT